MEFANFFSQKGDWLRSNCARQIAEIRGNANISVLPQTRYGFDRALKLYASRSDKQYSLTDCSSMAAMREHGLTEALTNDHHFAQEGFVALLSKEVKGP